MNSFELLAGLHENPTKEFYDAHKDEFVREVEEPFQRVMRQVAGRLPPPIRDRMETEKRIFSRFLKNDFGQGGAWPFYWGAFYPKGSKRSQDAQLSVSILPEFLEFGFYVGEYASVQRQRLQRDSVRHSQALEMQLGVILSANMFLYGDRSTFEIHQSGAVTSRYAGAAGWKEFLTDPLRFNSDVSVALSESQLLQLSEDELVARIADVHTKLFPLVLLAVDDDPIPAIADYLGLDEGEDEGPRLNEEYPLSQCATDTGFDKGELARWVRAIQRKKQAIFYGPPGTGKTYVARKLAQHLIGGGDGFFDLVQFHPAYAYEDFVQGIRPRPSPEGGLDYPVVPGRFVEFCREAEKRMGPCVLIVDEINRANLARVFGELMYLLEYREESIPLAAGGQFRIPDNVYLIGTMNTADRSIALVDHALRRRFAFLELRPNYEVLRKDLAVRNPGFPAEELISLLLDLNQRIANPHYAVGISFFLTKNLHADIGDIWRMEIQPYLDEYFFDQPVVAESFNWDHIRPRLNL